MITNSEIIRLIRELANVKIKRDILKKDRPGHMYIIGKTGEDNAALLGAMLTTKMELTALSRADISETDDD